MTFINDTSNTPKSRPPSRCYGLASPKRFAKASGEAEGT